MAHAYAAPYDKKEGNADKMDDVDDNDNDDGSSGNVIDNLHGYYKMSKANEVAAKAAKWSMSPHVES
jgi:hypothetical protein